MIKVSETRIQSDFVDKKSSVPQLKFQNKIIRTRILLKYRLIQIGLSLWQYITFKYMKSKIILD